MGLIFNLTQIIYWLGTWHCCETLHHSINIHGAWTRYFQNNPSKLLTLLHTYLMIINPMLGGEKSLSCRTMTSKKNPFNWRELTQEIRLFISQPPVDIHYPRSGLEAAAVEARVLKMKRDKKRYKMHWIEEKNVNQSVSSFKSKMRIRMHKELIGKTGHYQYQSFKYNFTWNSQVKNVLKWKLHWFV